MEYNNQEKDFQREADTFESEKAEISKFGNGDAQKEQADIPNTYTIDAQPNEENAERYDKLSKRSLVLGIIGLCIQYFLNIICCCGVPAIVLGIISIVDALKAKKLALNKKLEGMALGGFIVSIINIVSGALIILFVVVMVLIVMLAELSAY